MGEFTKEVDAPMVGASPSSPFIMDMDMNSALGGLPFTGPQQTMLPQVTKSRFEPKVKARPQVRGREAQPQSKAAFKPNAAPPAPAIPAVKQEQEAEIPMVLKPEPFLQQVKPEPIQDHGSLDFDFTFPVKADLPVNDAVPKPGMEGDQSSLPEVIMKKEEDAAADAYPDDEQDRLVREIDVYLHPTLGEQIKLYLLQYPLRPLWRPYSLEDRCEQEVHVKPQQSRVEIDLAVDTGGENYDEDAPDHLKIKKQLHLSPVHAIFQLRPSMRYFDDSDSATKKPSGSADLDEKMGEAEGEAPEDSPDLVEMQVTVRRRETERQEEMRVHSFEYLKKIDAAEALGMDSPDAVDVRQQMKWSGAFVILFEMPLKEYIKTLVPGRPSRVAVEVLAEDDGAGSAGLSRSFLDTLRLNDSFKVLLSRGRVHVLQFDGLMKLAPPGCSEQEVLDVLRGIVLLVQGC